MRNDVYFVNNMPATVATARLNNFKMNFEAYFLKLNAENGKKIFANILKQNNC